MSAVVGNKIKQITVDDYVKTDNFQILMVENPENFDERAVVSLPPNHFPLTMVAGVDIATIIKKWDYKNSYTVLIPIKDDRLRQIYNDVMQGMKLTAEDKFINSMNWESFWNVPPVGETETRGDKVLKELPDLSKINAQQLLDTTSIDEDSMGEFFWKISYSFDGIFSKQTAEYRGLCFERFTNIDKTNGKKLGWGAWHLTNDSHLFGSLKFDYLYPSIIDQNYMGWVCIGGKNKSTVFLKSKYPRFYDYMKKLINDTLLSGWEVTDTSINLISDPSGFYPRIAGNNDKRNSNTDNDTKTANAAESVDYTITKAVNRSKSEILFFNLWIYVGY